MEALQTGGGKASLTRPAEQQEVATLVAADEHRAREEAERKRNDLHITRRVV
jgi:hypothetical protein